MVRGVVQGVGFRPYAYGLAHRLDLGGSVLNGPRGVELALEGESDAIDRFLGELNASPPPMARILSVDVQEEAPAGQTEFTILQSDQEGDRTVLISPDLATCSDCLHELGSPDDRRYRYPFINCTNCGPRYTIIKDMPYDRASTTMAAFEMCGQCRAEYEDPSNRRFHAEPTCCPVCGPRVRLADATGERIACDDAIAESIRRLQSGQIVAVKGLGGFHLACDAASADAVRRLRKRKQRDLKPFAVMVRDINAAEAICSVTRAEREVLEGPQRPILLLTRRNGHSLADAVAPRSASFGVMLPYTPLHHLLLEGPFRALVMTSGNITDEPIAHDNEDALERLRDIADCFLLHDRGIHIRTDDSVARTIAGRLRFLRRSRGYAPFPVPLPFDTDQEVLAVGPELNNTVCVTRAGQAFLSHHVGDLQNVPAYEAFLQAVDHLKSVLATTPRTVACDLHPDYLSTRFARQCGLPLIAVQHHHAHIASVMAEAGRTDTVIGVSSDGMGWGSDDRPWGGEFLICDLADFDRAGHLEPVPQPGGDAAAKRPPRMAYAYLRAAFGADADRLAAELLPVFVEEELPVVRQMIEQGVNCPVTSSMGRLFDAASALLGICELNTYHAQAPMELEAKAEEAADEVGFYPVSVAAAGGAPVIARGADVIR